MSIVLISSTIVLDLRTLPNNPISRVLFGRTRNAVLALIYGRPDESFYVREIARTTGISPGAIQREVEQLAEAGLITRTQTGNQVFYQANPLNPVFAELRSLVTKTVGVIATLQAGLRPLSTQVRVAFVYGSVARQEETATSDVDLMIVGDADFDAVMGVISSLQAMLGREINPTNYTIREFKAKLAAGNHFLTSVLRSEKLFLIGTENDLRKLGAKRVA